MCCLDVAVVGGLATGPATFVDEHRMNTVINGFEVDTSGYILSGGKCCVTRLISVDAVWRFCSVLLGQHDFSLGDETGREP